MSAKPPGTPELAADGLYVFSGGGLELLVDPKREGNAVRLTLDGKSALAVPVTAATVFSAEIQGNTLLLTSPDGTLSKRYRLDAGRRAIEVSYTLSNATSEVLHRQASEAHDVALAGGLTFFPNAPKQPFAWIAHQPPRTTASVTTTLSAGQSWVASAGDGLLFVKAYVDPSPTTLSVASSYDAKTQERPWLELSAQSASFELPPGTLATWNVRWLLRHLPPGLAVKPGNQELVGFVQGVIQ